MPKSSELQGAGVALLFLRWFYFYNVTFENPVSLNDLMMFTHLSTAAGVPWVSMALLSVNSRLWLPEAVAVTRHRYRTAYTALPWKLSLISGPTPILWNRTVEINHERTEH